MRDSRRRGYRLRRYDSNSRILFITIPTELHERLHLTLHQEYRDQLVRANREYTWVTKGSTTFRPQGHPGGDGGEGDSTGGPQPERGSNGAWPTLVIEAGDSESLPALQNDMRWWFSASKHDVKIVLLAKFDHSSRQIVLERWEEVASQRQGATATRATPALIPELQQAITISRDITTNPVSYNVISGALVLKFRLLFLRDPGLEKEIL